MSIPKLKAYRLDPGYSESSDNDIRSLSNDELLPIFSKRFRISEGPEPMVGIRARGDARMVYRGSSVRPVVLSLNKDESSTTGALSTVPCVCDGWVLGKGNLHLKVGSAPNNAEELPRHVWDYEVTQKKLYRYDAPSDGSFSNGSGVAIWLNGEKTTDTSIAISENDIVESEDLSFFISNGIDATSIEVHMVDFISFKIGALWTTTSIGSSSSDGFDYSYIEAEYVPYEEMFNRTYDDLHVTRGSDVTPHAFSTLESNAANCGVAFGNIYNGEIDGRSMRHPATGGASVGPIDGLSTNLARCPQYYEGNYMFARKAMPMRIMKQSVAEDGSCDFTMSGTGVFADGLMKPVLFELVKASGTEKLIFKPLTELQATMQLAFVPDEHDPEKMTMKYSCSCVQSFYSDCKKPPELYLMYNFHDDDLGVLFDFDYDYQNYDPVLAEHESSGKTRFDELSYNTGALSVPDEIKDRFDSSMNHVWLRKEILAVESGRGYMPNFSGMKQLTVGIGTASIGWSSNRRYLNVYVDGKKIDYFDGENPNDVSYEIGEETLTVHGWSSSMHDFLVVFYETTSVNPNVASMNDGDSAIVGYRVPCYEKVKTTDLFVSSYPNWLKGHLNNDLDVFYGFKDYQGVKPGTDSEADPTGGWFPCYQQDGWHAMYPEGAVQFSEPLTQTDYLDILNFSYQENKNVLNDGGTTINLNNALEWIDGPDGISEKGKKLKKYHRKVWYNVAHYDGIYSVVRGRMSNYTVQGGAKYRLLEYDAYGDAAGRRWTIGANDTLRRMFEAGNVMMPQLKSNSTGDLEHLKRVESIALNSSEGDAYKCTLDGDRACYFLVEGNVLYSECQLLVKADEEGDEVEIFVQLNRNGKELSVKFGEESSKSLLLKGDFFQLDDVNDFEMPSAKHSAGDYDIVVELVGIYRDSASGTTVASYEFSVYRMEHSE